MSAAGKICWYIWINIWGLLSFTLQLISYLTGLRRKFHPVGLKQLASALRPGHCGG